MSDLITKYFENRLKKSGLEDFEVTYSLGYCQSDFVYISGRIDDSNIDAMGLVDFTGHEKNAIKRALDKDYQIEVYVRGGFSQCMYFDINESMYCELTKYEERVMDKFATHFRDFVNQLCSELRQEGYAIIEAGHFEVEEVKEVRTKNFVLKVRRLPEEHFLLEHIDDEMFESMCSSFIDGSSRYCVGAVSLFTTTGLELATDTIGSLTYEPGKRNDFSGYLKDMVRNCVATARQQASVLSQSVKGLH